MNMQRDMYCIM